MKPDFKTIIEIYNNSQESEKLIFIDVVNDLIKGIPKPMKAKKIPQSIYLEEIAKDTVKDMNFTSVKEYHLFLDDIKNFIYWDKDVTGRISWIFNLKKERTLLSREIKTYYQIIGAEELDIIHDSRIVFLKNLERYNFIEIFVSKNEQFQEICDEFMDTITKLDDKNKRVLIWLSNIKDKSSRNYLQRLEVDFWIDKVKKWVEYLFNDLQLENYLCVQKDIEDLYESLSWKKLPILTTKAVYVWDNISIEYNFDRVDFWEGTKPHKILSELFKSDNKWKVELWDIFPILYWEDYQYVNHKQEKRQISNSIAWINRRFKEISNWKKLLQFKDNVIKKLI